MTVKCAVNLDDIITIPKSLLIERITALNPEKMAAVARAIAFALDAVLNTTVFMYNRNKYLKNKDSGIVFRST